MRTQYEQKLHVAAQEHQVRIAELQQAIERIQQEAASALRTAMDKFAREHATLAEEHKAAQAQAISLQKLVDEVL